MVTYVMSTFRRMVWTKWPAPMPNPSPSPPVAMIVRPWFAHRIPSATGRERPWIPWNPYAERKWGRFEELDRHLDGRHHPVVPAAGAPRGLDLGLPEKGEGRSGRRRYLHATGHVGPPPLPWRRSPSGRRARRRT